ncbi:MAG: ADP-glyceromanno-heptose 6-epimerase [Candidatus Riflebacteria bacterium HGW-Riflebacteria-1]|jgi:ADP-L-glycero-D-manno-heptose 6-epimerase|nr:MAG: ADP-glyceromanno-heptose 6-epimerase [Candidatus Riflebacteria bacterium HGW-Riflebacteria-1]
MILVTGGAGFIGSVIVWALNQRGIDDIIIVDHLGTGDKWKNLTGLRFIDYCEKADFLSYLDKGAFDGHKLDAVLHLGACSSTTETDASYLIKNNFEFSKALALWANGNRARFIYASSAATYGDGEHGFDDNPAEIEKLTPLNMYGYSKQLFDLWLKRKGLLDKCVGIKYFNVFGPNEYHKGSMRSFILKSFEQISQAGEVKLFKSHHPDYGDGEQLRDFIYVKDAAAMTLHFLDNQAGGLFNVATGMARNWNDLVKATFAAMGKPARISYVDMPDSIRNQYQYYTCGNIERIRQTGYTKPIFTLEQAIDDYVKNYLQTTSYLGN